MDDLFNGDNFYGKQMKLEFEAWRKMYPDQKFSMREYTKNQLNTYAFQYTSIRDQPENKEFGWQMAILGATIISAGVTLFCPPVGLVLLGAVGVVSGALELYSAITGKDWASGHELGKGERMLRGTFGVLDLVPGVSGITKFCGITPKLLKFSEPFLLKAKNFIKTTADQGINTIKTAADHGINWIKATADLGKNKIKNLVDKA